MKKYILIILVLFCFFSNNAQIKQLNLEKCIEIAIDSSLQAFRSKNLYMASYWEYRTFKAGRLPALTLALTPIQYNRDFTKRYDSQNNIDIYRKQQSLYSSGNLSVSQNFDLTGGTFFVDSELGFLRSFGDNTYSQFNTIPIRIGYYQSLFGFNKFKWEKRIEPLKYEKAKKQFLASQEGISETVIRYFFDLAMAQAEYKMAIDNVGASDTLYHIGQERHKIASISQADLLTLKLDAINAKNTFKNTEIELKRSMFNFISFLNLDKETKVVLDLPQRPKNMTISAERAIGYARENNPDFLVNKQDIMEAEQEVDRAKKSSKFDASFSVSVGFNQIADKFSEAYRKPLQQDIVSIGLTIPLMDWGVRKGKLNMARNNLNVAKISVQQKELSLEQDVLMTVSDFNIQQDLIMSAEEALELANTAYNSIKQRFIIGKTDISSLTLVLNRQKDAQKNYISALRNYWLSYYKIRKLTLYDFNKEVPLSYLFDELLELK